MRNTTDRSLGITGNGNHPGSTPTQRELEVLQLLCDGLTTRQIAARLGISFKTAACHRERLLGKAGVHGSIALFRWALLSGLVSLSDPDTDNRTLPEIRQATGS